MPDQGLIHFLAELLDAKTRAEAAHIPVPQSVTETIDAMAKLAKTQAEKALEATSAAA